MLSFDCAGVYSLNVDGKCLYVGSSNNIKRRLAAHKGYLKNGKHSDELQAAYDNGKEIVPEILQVLPENGNLRDLLLMENKWIERLNPPCNKKPAIQKDPFLDIIDCAIYARQERINCLTAKYEYQQLSGENREMFFGCILYPLPKDI